MSLANVTGVSTVKMWTDSTSGDFTTTYLMANDCHCVNIYIGVKFKLKNNTLPPPTEDECAKEIAMQLIDNITGTDPEHVYQSERTDLIDILYNPQRQANKQTLYSETDDGNFDWVCKLKLVSNKTINPSFVEENIAVKFSFVDSNENNIEVDTSANSKFSIKSFVKVYCCKPPVYTANSNNADSVIIKRDNSIAGLSWHSEHEKSTDYDDFIYRMTFKDPYYKITKFSAEPGTRVHNNMNDYQLYVHTGKTSKVMWDRLQNLYCPTLKHGLGHKSYNDSFYADADDLPVLWDCGYHSGVIYQNDYEVIFYASHITVKAPLAKSGQSATGDFHLQDQYGNKCRVQVAYNINDDHDAVPLVSNVWMK